MLLASRKLEQLPLSSPDCRGIQLAKSGTVWKKTLLRARTGLEWSSVGLAIRLRLRETAYNIQGHLTPTED